MPWEQFAPRLERQFKRCGWDWSDYGSEFTIDHRTLSDIRLHNSVLVDFRNICVCSGRNI
jgi:hypothetical protein